MIAPKVEMSNQFFFYGLILNLIELKQFEMEKAATTATTFNGRRGARRDADGIHNPPISEKLLTHHFVVHRYHV